MPNTKLTNIKRVVKIVKNPLGGNYAILETEKLDIGFSVYLVVKNYANEKIWYGGGTIVFDVKEGERLIKSYLKQAMKKLTKKHDEDTTMCENKKYNVCCSGKKFAVSAQDVAQACAKVEKIRDAKYLVTYALDGKYSKAYVVAQNEQTARKKVLDYFGNKKCESVRILSINSECNAEEDKSAVEVKDKSSVLAEYRKISKDGIQLAQLIEHNNGYTVVSTNPEEDKDFGTLNSAQAYISKLGYKENI